MTASRSNKPTAERMRAQGWSKPDGMLIAWIRKYEKTHSRAAVAMVQWCYQTAVSAIGEQATIEAVRLAGLELPAVVYTSNYASGAQAEHKRNDGTPSQVRNEATTA